MKLKKAAKHTNGVRHQIKIQKNLLSKYNSVQKNLLIKKLSSGGRNNTGRVTVRHIGSGVKRKIHVLNNLKKYYAVVLNTMYNCNSGSFVLLNFDLKEKTFFKTIAVKNLYPGCLLESNNRLKEYKLGYTSLLHKLPSGIILNSITVDSKVIYAKSAGSFSQLIEKKNDKVKIKLPSGAITSFTSNTYGTIGYLDNSIKKTTVIGKAGVSRLKGIRPSVRGIAMNPVDHPHGGKSNKGMPQVTPWGIPTKNKKTVLRKNI